MISDYMSFADAVIFLREWDSLQDDEFITKSKIELFMKAFCVVYGGRK